MSRMTSLPLLEFATLIVVLAACTYVLIPGSEELVIGFLHAKPERTPVANSSIAKIEIPDISAFESENSDSVTRNHKNETESDGDEIQPLTLADFNSTNQKGFGNETLTVSDLSYDSFAEQLKNLPDLPEEDLALNVELPGIASSDSMSGSNTELKEETQLDDVPFVIDEEWEQELAVDLNESSPDSTFEIPLKEDPHNSETQMAETQTTDPAVLRTEITPIEESDFQNEIEFLDADYTSGDEFAHESKTESVLPESPQVKNEAQKAQTSNPLRQVLDHETEQFAAIGKLIREQDYLKRNRMDGNLAEQPIRKAMENISDGSQTSDAHDNNVPVKKLELRPIQRPQRKPVFRQPMAAKAMLIRDNDFQRR